MSINSPGPREWVPATAPVTAEDTPVPLTVRTTVSELRAGDLFLPIKRETLAMNIPIVLFASPVDLDGMSIRGHEIEDMHCVILRGDTAAKLIPSDKVVFRAKRPEEWHTIRPAETSTRK